MLSSNYLTSSEMQEIKARYWAPHMPMNYLVQADNALYHHLLAEDQVHGSATFHNKPKEEPMGTEAKYIQTQYPGFQVFLIRHGFHTTLCLKDSKGNWITQNGTDAPETYGDRDSALRRARSLASEHYSSVQGTIKFDCTRANPWFVASNSLTPKENPVNSPAIPPRAPSTYAVPLPVPVPTVEEAKANLEAAKAAAKAERQRAAEEAKNKAAAEAATAAKQEKLTYIEQLTDLAVETTALLGDIRTLHRGICTYTTPRKWVFQSEMQALAKSLGYKIVPIGNGSLQSLVQL